MPPQPLQGQRPPVAPRVIASRARSGPRGCSRQGGHSPRTSVTAGRRSASGEARRESAHPRSSSLPHRVVGGQQMRSAQRTYESRYPYTALNLAETRKFGMNRTSSSCEPETLQWGGCRGGEVRAGCYGGTSKGGRKIFKIFLVNRQMPVGCIA
jgi:hypothetical protein